MAYIGKQPIVGNFQKCDAISVVNGQAAYTLQVSSTNVVPESANHMLVSLNGILQAPVTSFTVSGSTLTFASNLATGDVIDFVILLGNVLDLGTPSDNTVSIAKLTASGTASSSNFLRGDNSWAVPSGGKVGQVVQTSKTDTYSESIGANTMSTTNMTGMSVAITPSATSSKVLILASLSVGRDSTDSNSMIGIQLVRGTTLIGVGDAASSRTRVASLGPVVNNKHSLTMPIMYLDSPSSTSEVSYHFRFLNSDGDSSTLYLNRSETDDDSSYVGRLASSATAMEILS